MTWQEDFERDMLSNWALPPVLFVEGEGSWLTDNHGKKYLDFLAGIAVNALGHAHPVFVNALEEQASTLGHISNLFASKPELKLAAKLKQIAGTGERGRVFFANSGTEAIEASLKLARKHKPHGNIVSLNKSFHGRTFGSMAVTGKASLQAPFEPNLPGVVQIDATLEALEAAINENTAALVLEIYRGEAGVLPLPEGFLKLARTLTHKNDAILIIDEIQTGMGRTGSWFAFQQEQVSPDIIALAKGIAGGFPMGAVVTFGDVGTLFRVGEHGTTFGGNPLACAVSLAVIQEIEDAQLLDNVQARSQQIIDGIFEMKSSLVETITGKGLMLGIKLTGNHASKIVSRALNKGLIINAPDADVVRLVPPLNLTEEDTHEFLTLFAGILASVEQESK